MKNNSSVIPNQRVPSGLYCSIWKCAVIPHTWQEKQPFSLCARSMWISAFVPFETALFHFQRPTAFYDTLPAVFKSAVRAVCSAARAARKRRVYSCVFTPVSQVTGSAGPVDVLPQDE